MPVDPTQAIAAGVRDMATTGADWSVGGVDAISEAGGEGGQGFGGMLSSSLKGLTSMQNEAAGASQSLAAGTAEDVSSVVMAVERARLSMQLASQIRSRGVEAYQDIFRTAV